MSDPEFITVQQR